MHPSCLPQQELKLKDKECERLSKVREQLEQELEELTASLFEVPPSSFSHRFLKLSSLPTPEKVYLKGLPQPYHLPQLPPSLCCSFSLESCAELPPEPHRSWYLLLGRVCMRSFPLLTAVW